jgi:hypothetical protein
MTSKTAISMFSLSALILALAGCTPPPPPPTPTPTPIPASAVCVDFEPPLVLGDQYGTPAGQMPGDKAFATPNGVTVSVWDFSYTGGGGTFNLAQIDAATATFGSGQTIGTNNINLEFDFSQLGFETAQVDFEFLDKGGFENISVNGSPVFAGELSSAPTPLGGVSLTFSLIPGTNERRGSETLKGVVKTLRVGGQEFWIDNVCAQP